MKLNIKQFDPSPEDLAYYESKTCFEEAWQDSLNGEWMLWIAVKLGVSDRVLTLAKALCANTVRHLMLDKRSTDAVDAAIRYFNNDISR
jgi:hypothetical protein